MSDRVHQRIYYSADGEERPQSDWNDLADGKEPGVACNALVEVVIYGLNTVHDTHSHANDDRKNNAKTHKEDLGFLFRVKWGEETMQAAW